jgi:hypothetical protein
MMRVLAFRMLVGAALLAGSGLLAACGGDDPPPNTAPPTGATASGGTTPSAGSASPGPTGSATALVEFTVDGAGPYQLDTTLTQLQTAGLLSNVVTGGAPCPQTTTARGTGAWADLHLSFHDDGALYLAVNRSPTVPTPSGAWLGTTLADLKKIYKGLPGVEVKSGADTGYVVRTVSGRGILFALDTAKTVAWMAAGDASYLISTFQAGSEFC